MQAVQLTSQIDEVVVFRSGALVTRSAELTRSDGTDQARVRIGNLPLSLLDGSLKARIEGDGGELPIASDLRVGLSVPDADDDLRPPKNVELEAAEREVERLTEQQAQIERELDRLRALPVPERPGDDDGSKPPPLLTPARLALGRFRGEELRRLGAEKREGVPKLRAARRELAQLQDLERRASTARQAQVHELRKCVDVSLRRCDAAGRARLVLEYVVPGARWAPAYTARLDHEMRAGAIALRAIVCQNSGEDWRNIALTLSTADAQGWTELPELRSKRIGRRQPPVVKTGWRPPPTGAEVLYEGYDRAFAAGPETGRPGPSGAASPAVDPAPSSQRQRGRVQAFAALPKQMRKMLKAKANELGVDVLALMAGEVPLPGGVDSSSMTRAGSINFGGMPPEPPRPPSAPAGPPPGFTAGSVADLDAKIAMVEEASIEAELSMELEEEDDLPTAEAAPMPPPAMAQAAPMRARSSALGAIGGAVSGVADGIADRVGGFAEPKKKAKRRRDKSDERERRDAAPAALTSAEEMMAYGELQMPGPRAARRGKLVLTQRRERYLSILEEQRVEVSFDVVEAVESAARAASGVGQVNLPAGYQPPSRHAGFDYAFHAEARVDVPSDSTFHNVALTQKPSEIALRYVIVPRETPDAFRFVHLENPFAAPLLPGPADVYVGGDFLLTTPFKLAAPEGKVEFGLGVEQALKVSRNTHFAEEATGLMGGTTELRHEIEIELINHLEIHADVEIRERVPVTVEDEDDIEVKQVEVEPPWEELDQERRPIEGGYRWELVLEPGEKRAFKAIYVVAIPSKLELVGGNRREG